MRGKLDLHVRRDGVNTNPRHPQSDIQQLTDERVHAPGYLIRQSGNVVLNER